MTFLPCAVSSHSFSVPSKSIWHAPADRAIVMVCGTSVAAAVKRRKLKLQANVESSF